MRLGKQTLRKLVREELSKVNEGIEPQIKKIAQLTGTRPDAVEDFVSKHALNFTKLLKFLQKGKLKDRMDFMTAVSGKPGNPIQKKMIKMFTESVVNEGKFKVDDLVYNKRTKTVGIVRMGDDKHGEVKTDADGNVSVDELEKYNPLKYKHQTKAKVAPSTEREVSKRGLFNPFKLESVVNERKPSKIVWDTKKISAAKRINVSKWYMKTYPTDELGGEINQKLTLWDFYNALSQNRDIYKVIGVGDSVVRERIFEKLSKVLGVAYDTIYNMWESINEANGKVDLSLPFAVIRKGGSIGSSTKNYIPTDKGVIVSTFNNQNDAKEEAASLRKTLSPQAKQYYKTTYTVTKLTDYKRKLIKNKTESINEASDEFVIYVEKDNGRKKLLHNNKSSRAAKMFITKNANKILNQPGIRAVGSMRKSDWERDEAQYAENIKKKGMRTVTKKQWDRTHNDYKGMIKGQPYMMWFDKKTQSTVYGPVQIKESVVNEGKDDFVARHGKANIILKKGYKHHKDTDLEKLYDKLGSLVKGLKVKDVTLVFESVNEANVNKLLRDEVARKLKVNPNSLTVGMGVRPRKTSDGNFIVVIGLDRKIKKINIPQVDYFGNEVSYGGNLVVKTSPQGKLLKVLDRVDNVMKIKLSDYVNEGRAFVAAAKKAKEEGKTEFEFNGKTYPVTIKEVLRKRNRKLR